MPGPPRVVGARSTWNTGGGWSCAKSCAKSCVPCRTSGGPRPRQHWGFEASVIPTTRPPRIRSGSRDHTLVQLVEAGAVATRAVPQAVSCKPDLEQQGEEKERQLQKHDTDPERDFVELRE